MRWLALVACGGCSTYVQHRAALVPHSTPVQTTGQRAAWRGTASLGASSVGDLAAPGVGDPNAGVAIPSRQLRGALDLAVTRNLTLGVWREEGLASSAQPIKSTLPPVGDEGVSGGGVTINYSIPTGSAWRVGLSFELGAWNVPWVEYSQCIENCYGGPHVIMSTGETAVESFGIGIVPSYQVGNWTLFGGLTGRNHPTIEEKVINQGEYPDVKSGPMNAIVHAGAAYEAGERVQFVVEMHHTITQDPVAYAPGVGVSIVIGLGPRFAKVDPPPPPIVMTSTGAPGLAAPPAAPPVVPLTPEEAALRRPEAERLTKEAHTLATRGECEAVRMLDARVRELDAQFHARVFMQDALIAYCVTP